MANHDQKKDPQQNTEYGRRDFLSRTGSLLLWGSAAAVAAGSVRVFVPNCHADFEPRIVLGKPSDFKIRTVNWLRQHDLFVLHDDTGFGAFSARCTHLGCTVRRVSSGFVCPCHGARFDAKGKVISGPARTDLPWYHMWLDSSSQLWVDLDRQVKPGTTISGWQESDTNAADKENS